MSDVDFGVDVVLLLLLPPSVFVVPCDLDEGFVTWARVCATTEVFLGAGEYHKVFWGACELVLGAFGVAEAFALAEVVAGAFGFAEALHFALAEVVSEASQLDKMLVLVGLARACKSTSAGGGGGGRWVGLLEFPIRARPVVRGCPFDFSNDLFFSFRPWAPPPPSGLEAVLRPRVAPI